MSTELTDTGIAQLLDIASGKVELVKKLSQDFSRSVELSQSSLAQSSGTGSEVAASPDEDSPENESP